MSKTLSDLRNARYAILNAKLSISADMDEPGADIDALNDILDELDKAYDSLCEASSALEDLEEG